RRVPTERLDVRVRATAGEVVGDQEVAGGAGDRTRTRREVRRVLRRPVLAEFEIEVDVAGAGNALADPGEVDVRTRRAHPTVDVCPEDVPLVGVRTAGAADPRARVEFLRPLRETAVRGVVRGDRR